VKTVVLGAGRSGLALTGHLLKKGQSVIVSDSRTAEQLSESDLWPRFQELDRRFPDKLTWELGGHPLSLLEKCDQVAISPGVSLHVPFLQEALSRRIRVTGEMELAFSACRQPMIAVTGTNGKSSTCSLLGQMFGPKGVVGGNIGTALLSLVESPSREVEWVVAEVSSFQLETVHTFCPRIGILTNLTPDHLDHHKDLEEYRIAKSRMFAQMGEGDTAIFCHDDPVATTIREELASRDLPPWIDGFPVPRRDQGPRILTYSALNPVPNGLAIQDDWVVRYTDGTGEKLFPWEAPGLVGRAMMGNGLAAILAALEAGLSVEEIQDGLRRFHPLRYRMERAGEINGIIYINDSKATNIDSALASVKAIDGSLAVIVGGKDKGVRYEGLAEGLKARNGRVFLIGEAAEPIEKAFQDVHFENFQQSHTMGQALQEATDFLHPRGGTVLLAPACSSFDQFKSAEQRGQIFNDMVSELKDTRERNG